MAMKRMLGYAAGGAALGLPIGAAISYLRHKHDKARNDYGGLTQPLRTSDFPLIPSVGPLTKKPEKEDKAKAEKKGGVLNLLKKPATLTGLAGAGAGSLIGSAATSKVMAIDEAKRLDEELAQRKAMFNKLLTQEQANAAAAAVKTAGVNDIESAVEVLAAAVYKHVGLHKESGISSLVGGVGQSIDDMLKAVIRTDRKFDENKAKKMLLLAFGGGAAVGAGEGYRRMAAADPNRNREKNLQSSLEARLKGDPEGPAAPIVLKLSPERLGLSTVPGTESALTNPTANRDILANL